MLNLGNKETLIQFYLKRRRDGTIINNLLMYNNESIFLYGGFSVKDAEDNWNTIAFQLTESDLTDPSDAIAGYSSVFLMFSAGGIIVFILKKKTSELSKIQ